MKKQSYPELITALDLGSTSIRVAVGQLSHTMDGKDDVQIVGMVEVPSEGIHRGVITSIEETVSSLSHALEQTERLVGVPIEHLWVGISGTDVLAQESRGVIAVAKPDGEISGDDVNRVLDAAKTVAIPLNYEILHVIPKSYNVDGQTGIKDPVGMTGIRMEVNAQMIYAVSSHLKNITKAIYRTGVDIDDLVLSVLATGEAVTTSRQRELGVTVVNMGGSSTSMVVYEQGDIIHTAVIPLGAEHITNDLAIGLRTSLDIAERVKVEYGTCLPQSVGKKEEMDLVTVGGGASEVVSLQYVAEIIQARTEEILEKINLELDRVGYSGRLPAGIVFTGGGAKLHGLVDLAKEQLSLPARVGEPMFMSGASQYVGDPAFAPVMSLVKWGSSIYGEGGKGRQSSFRGGANQVVARLKNVWRSLIP